MAINFVKNDDIRILRDIEQYYSTQIDEMPMNGEKIRPRLCLSQLRVRPLDAGLGVFCEEVPLGPVR